jgi:hypothetical protein
MFGCGGWIFSECFNFVGLGVTFDSTFASTLEPEASSQISTHEEATTGSKTSTILVETTAASFEPITEHDPVFTTSGVTSTLDSVDLYESTISIVRDAGTETSGVPQEKQLKSGWVMFWKFGWLIL